MRKLLIIAQREFLARVRKRSFMVITLLGPLIMLVLMILPYWLTSGKKAAIQATHVLVVNNTTTPLAFADKEQRQITVLNESTDTADLQQVFRESHYHLMFFVGEDGENARIHVFQKGAYEGIELLTTQIQNQLLASRLSKPADISVRNNYVAPQEKGTEVKQFLSYSAVLVTYFFIFLYGMQVMKGVVEEKGNRIIEVMISSVRPFQLMGGKILGTSWAGLVQFGIWLLTFVCGAALLGNYFKIGRFRDEQMEGMLAQGVSADLALEMNALVEQLSTINVPVVIFFFLVFFYVGYLLYAALFAIIGAASDTDTDTQQFIFPLTIPLLFSVVMLSEVLMDPHGSMARILSFIPLTSLLIMPARLPFHADMGAAFWGDLALSLILLIAAVVLFTWIAGRIYRVGILVYGKKTGYKELVKWFFMK